MAETPRLILASGSRARRAMLEAAGLSFEVVPADVDEDAIKQTMISESACVEGADVAAVLAAEKAVSISRAHPAARVIGADQVLSLGMRLFSKADSLAEARDTLDHLRGRTHELASAVAIAEDGAVTWHAVDRANMTMRRFSDEFLGSYLNRVGNRVLSSVGCYELEGLGVQLFERIEGDYFTVLGMPLLPLLARLREDGMVMT